MFIKFALLALALGFTAAVCILSGKQSAREQHTA